MANAAPSLPADGEAIESPPDSGVRESVNRIAPPPPSSRPSRLTRPSTRMPAASTRASMPTPARPLTYSIYTVAELQSHIAETHRNAAAPAPVIGWPDFVAAAKAATRALVAWSRLPKPRPSVREAARHELVTLVAVTRAVAKTVPWQRLGVMTLGVVACLGALLFLVIGVAEMTDDLKPGRRAAGAVVVAPPTASAAPIVAAAPLPAAAPTVATLEILDPPSPPPPPPKAKAKKARPKAKPAAERFIP